MTSKKEKRLLRRQAKAQANLEKFLNKIHSRIDLNVSDDDLEKQITEAIHEMRDVKGSERFRTKVCKEK